MRNAHRPVLAFFLLLVSSATASASFFVMPYDAKVFLQPTGGSAGAATEFGLGTSPNNLVPIFTGLPNTPNPNAEVLIGTFSAGASLDFYQRTVFGGTFLAFSGGTDQASLVAFTDTNNSLGLGGSAVQQLSSTTWLLHLDDAASSLFDDDDNDVLIRLRLEPVDAQPVPEPASVLLLGGGLLALAPYSRWRRKPPAA